MTTQMTIEEDLTMTPAEEILAAQLPEPSSWRHILALLPLDPGLVMVVRETGGMFLVIAEVDGKATLARYAELSTAVDEAIAVYRRQGGPDA